ASPTWRVPLRPRVARGGQREIVTGIAGPATLAGGWTGPQTPGRIAGRKPENRTPAAQRQASLPGKFAPGAAPMRPPATPLFRLLGTALALALLGGGSRAQAARLPDGFSETPVASGITGATAMAIAPDGRGFVCEQTGALRVVKDDVLLPRPFVTVTVDSSWERGLIGVALDPDFPKRPFVYVNYVAPAPYPHHRISRFTAEGDVAVAGSEVVLF